MFLVHTVNNCDLCKIQPTPFYPKKLKINTKILTLMKSRVAFFYVFASKTIMSLSLLQFVSTSKLLWVWVCFKLHNHCAFIPSAPFMYARPIIAPIFTLATTTP